MLTQERLKQLLSYDPETGLFVRLCGRGSSKAGSVVARRNRDGYCRIYIEGREYLCHRLAFLYMTGSLPSQEVDHLNHVRDDNRWANLRQASHKQNCKNKGRYANSSKIYPGVAWSERAKKWIATIWSDGKQTHIGTFTGPDEAILARKHAEKAHGFHINHAAMTTERR